VPLVSYAAVTFFSMLWWYLGSVPVPTPHTVVYGGSVALVTGGLLLAWQVLQARYGDVALDQIRGLARPMPRFAFLFAMLMMAAMGLPPFGVFSGYVGMLLAPLFTPTAGLILVLLAWLTASWYLLTMLQHVLFGRHRADLLYDDLRPTEAVSLAIVLAGLLGLGLWSDGEMAPISARTPVSAQGTGLTWTR
jgi:NADH-quinone oxidoreductase subunit M